MNLPRNTYYHKSKSDFGDESELIPQIEAIIEDFPGYGYRRNIIVNHKKVLRIMRQRGLLRKTQRRWVKTTDSDHNQRIYPNLIKNLIVTGPNQVWAADITYIGKGIPMTMPLLKAFSKQSRLKKSISGNTGL